MLSTPFFVDNVDNSVYNLFLGMFSVVNYVDNLWTSMFIKLARVEKPRFLCAISTKRGFKVLYD